MGDLLRRLNRIEPAARQPGQAVRRVPVCLLVLATLVSEIWAMIRPTRRKGNLQ